MKKIVLLVFLLTSFGFSQSQTQIDSLQKILKDWANFNRYKNENAKLILTYSNKNRIVFMGNSITEEWMRFQPEFFSDNRYINRGIGGQTTPQMLIRFRLDVIDLRPTAVVILAGINDIAENTGPSTVKMIADNIISMAELAESNGIKVIISSILPASGFSWSPIHDPPPKILAINTIIKNYAEKNGMTYLDYYSSMVDDKEGLKKEYGLDEVHPNKKGYQVMSMLVEKAIANMLSLDHNKK